MGIELAKYLVSVPASCYILDCVPNPAPKEIKERAYNFIKYMLDHKKGTPFILIESVFRENGHRDKTVGNRVTKQNRFFKEAHEKLKKGGYQNMYYIPSDGLIGNDHDATIDGVHFTNRGFERIAQKMSAILNKVVK